MKIKSAWLVVGLAAVVQHAVAEQYSFVGHRAQGMGGANAATVNDSSAQWHNPAAFGFFNRAADEVPGLQTNVVSNLVIQVEQSSVTNEVPADVVEMVMVTNEVPMEVVETGTNGVAVTNTVMEAQVAERSVTNAAVDYQVVMLSVTNRHYEYKDVVVEVMTEPERARADNMKLHENNWGWNIIGLGAGYTMTEDMPEYVNMIGRIDYDSFDSDGLDGTPEGVESVILITSALSGLAGNPDNAFYVDTTAGMSFRLGSWGIGARMFGEVAGFVDYLDRDNMGLDISVTDYVADINAAAARDGFVAADWDYKSIAAGDLADIAAVDGDAEKYIDYKLTKLKQEGVLTGANIDDAVDLFNDFTYDVPTTATNSYENNKTTVTARGFGLFEVPVSFGYAFNDNLSVGITAKGMYGTVTGTKVQATNEDSFDAAVDHLEENTEASFNFGLDLGVLYRMDMLQFACVAHNINAPKFKGFTDEIEIENEDGDVIDSVSIHVPDYTMDPQITLGAAFVPSKRFMVEMSYDLLETGTLMENYNIQRLSFGTEIDFWLLALRLGAYNNLAADWQDWIATGGLGINLWAMRFDVGGAYSIGENAEYEGSEIPEEARLYAALSMEF